MSKINKLLYLSVFVLTLASCREQQEPKSRASEKSWTQAFEHFPEKVFFNLELGSSKAYTDSLLTSKGYRLDSIEKTYIHKENNDLLPEKVVVSYSPDTTIQLVKLNYLSHNSNEAFQTLLPFFQKKADRIFQNDGLIEMYFERDRSKLQLFLIRLEKSTEIRIKTKEA